MDVPTLRVICSYAAPRTFSRPNPECWYCRDIKQTSFAKEWPFHYPVTFVSWRKFLRFLRRCTVATGSADTAGVRSDKRGRRYRFDVDCINGLFWGFEFIVFKYMPAV